MAQSGYTPISLYYSATPTAQPAAGDLVAGELALNTADGKLYFKNSSNVVTLLASSSDLGGVSTFSGGTTGLTPSSATSGAITLAGTLVVSNGGTGLTSLTAGRIPFGAGTSAFGNSASLFWDSGNSRLGINTATPAVTASFIGTDAIQLPVGTTGQQPTGAAGMLRFNSTTTSFEGYNGSSWTSVGGITLVDDTTTAATRYPLFAAATSGAVTTEYVSSTKLNYNPSTGAFTAPEVVSSNGFVVHGTTVSTSYTITSGNNALSVGPVTVASGATVTVSSGQRWLVL